MAKAFQPNFQGYQAEPMDYFMDDLMEGYIRVNTIEDKKTRQKVYEAIELLQQFRDFHLKNCNEEF